MAAGLQSIMASYMIPAVVMVAQCARWTMPEMRANMRCKGVSLPSSADSSMTTFRVSTMTPSKKLCELIIYVSKRSFDDPSFGSIKLNKLLFLSDFWHYTKTGSSITGAIYHRQPYGPCVSGMRDTLKRMERDDDIFQYTHPNEGAGPGRRQVLANRAADLSVFSASEIALVDELISNFRESTAMALSDYSHQFALWKLAQPGEEIPYFAAHVADEVPVLSESQLRWAMEIANRA